MREKITPNSLQSDGGQSPKNVRVQQGGLLQNEEKTKRNRKRKRRYRKSPAIHGECLQEFKKENCVWAHFKSQKNLEKYL